MDRLYVFLIHNDIWIYILSAIGLVWYLTEYWRSRGILRSAIFGLEKEKGRRIRQRAVILVIVFSAIIALVTFVNLSIAPTLPVELLKPPTPTPNIFATPLSPPTSAVSERTRALEIAPTVTLPGSSLISTATTDNVSVDDEPTATPYPDILTGACTPEINITSPPNLTTVGTFLTVFGTAAGGQLASYNLEALGPETNGSWLTMSESENLPVQDGILGTLDFEGLPEGVYFVRLRAFDEEGEQMAQCAIELLVGSEPS